MAGETNLKELIKGMTPKLNDGEYVFVTVDNLDLIDNSSKIICEFKERVAIVIKQEG